MARMLLLLLFQVCVSLAQCPPCSSEDCTFLRCADTLPYACASGPAKGGCAATPSSWSDPATCDRCCLTTSCVRDCDSQCSESDCLQYKCGPSVPFLCTSGIDRGACGKANTWSYNPDCNDCCDTTTCSVTPPPLCPACTEEQCRSAQCPAFAPYECIEGTAKSGCAKNPTDWKDNPSCTTCCNVLPCKNPPTPPPTKAPTPPPTSPSACPFCTEDQCATVKCVAAAPYECIKGDAKGGCAPNATIWKNSPACTLCCNVMSCLGPTEPTTTTPKPTRPPTKPPTTPVPTKPPICPLCTLAECATAHCASDAPYECIEGRALGGCSIDPTTWKDTPDCTACCNALSCFGPTRPPDTTLPPKPITTTTRAPTAAPTTTAAPTKPPICGNCNADQCHNAQCSTDVPFWCSAGNAKGGCSKDPNTWKDTPECSECCDVRTCGNRPTTTVTHPATTTQPTTYQPTTTKRPRTTIPYTTENTQTAAPTGTSPPITHPPSICPPCSDEECAVTSCRGKMVYACLEGAGKGQCAVTAAAFQDHDVCMACCDTLRCTGPTGAPTPSPCPPCSDSLCNMKPHHCPPQAPFQCLGGTAAGGCFTVASLNNNSCTSCCDLSRCYWSPPVCYPCKDEICKNHSLSCGRRVPYICTAGSSKGGCSNTSTTWNTDEGCDDCCDYTSCLGPPPTPRPKNPWDLVPKSNNCTLTKLPVMSPDSKATPYGGIDVSGLGCKASVSESCCGFTPRFNWIISTCNKEQRNRTSMACRHVGGNTSAVDAYYMAAYQWNGSAWNLDHQSSVLPTKPKSLVDFSRFYVGGGSNQDWDIKFAPTTNNSGTMGLGPPAMLFVLSAKKFAWSSLFVLNQITLNRGPGGEFYEDNCWSSSSGEFDLIEPAFWDGVTIPLDRLYTTITADAGRCLPVSKAVPRRFRPECNTNYCCEMCSCPEDDVCFGDKADIGYQPMGCVPQVNKSQIPENAFVFKMNGNDTKCGSYFGGVSGGAESTAYFTQADGDGNGEVIYASVVDRQGVYVYRWPADDETRAASVWAGIGKYRPAESLTQAKPDTIEMHPPCTSWNTPCGIYEPSCHGDCPLIEGAGIYGLNQQTGAYAAECSRDGLNWWELFADTKQALGAKTVVLPRHTVVPHFDPPLPYYCNVTCGDKLCRAPNRCPGSNPYMCTAGDGIGGCNNESRFWPLSPHCASCCDVRMCSKPCEYCTSSECAAASCGVETPFVCTDGPDKGGCAATSGFWPGIPTCYSCCNTQSCPHPNRNTRRKS